MNISSRLMVVTDFFDRACEMRMIYDQSFSRPFIVSKERFIWDYWYVPNQYTYLRTFAESFFPADLYNQFMHHLSLWGREYLGCDRLVTPWLSYYIDGCCQELHVDNSHGSWAYVFSLTDWDNRSFRGGETVLISTESLEIDCYSKPSSIEKEEASTYLIPPRFNQLTIFDPNILHCVRPIRGTQDPQRCRVVLHGWFSKPTFSVSETIGNNVSNSIFFSVITQLKEKLKEFDNVTGSVAIRLEIQIDGTIEVIRFLSDRLYSIDGNNTSVILVKQEITDCLSIIRFPPISSKGWANLPLELPIFNEQKSTITGVKSVF